MWHCNQPIRVLCSIGSEMSNRTKLRLFAYPFLVYHRVHLCRNAIKGLMNVTSIVLSLICRWTANATTPVSAPTGRSNARPVWTLWKTTVNVAVCVRASREICVTTGTNVTSTKGCTVTSRLEMDPWEYAEVRVDENYFYNMYMDCCGKENSHKIHANNTQLLAGNCSWWKFTFRVL